MKLKRGVKGLVVTLVATIGMNAIVLAGPVFNDVPTSHWGYPYIMDVAEKGIIVGDISGNYRPDEVLNKFDMSKILAQLSGYKYSGATAEEVAYYNACYNKNAAFLRKYSQAFKKWDVTADEEIAFLLEKEVLTPSDLNQFVIKMTDGSEALRVLTREDAAYFLTKAEGQSSTALSKTYTNKFNDDSAIDSSRKAYAYFMDEEKIINRDAKGNYNPKGTVTRAMMAVMVSKTLGDDVSNNTSTGGNGNSGTSTGTTTNVTTVTGTMDVYYESLNTIQITDLNTGVQNLYMVGPTAKIYVDGYIKTAKDLKPGMQIVGVLVDGKTLVDIKAQSNNKGTDTTVDTSSNNVVLTNIEGAVLATNDGVATKTLDIEMKNKSENGYILTEVKSYALASNVTIKRNDKDYDFAKISVGDVVYGKVSGSTIYSIDVVDAERTIKGKVTAKYLPTNSKYPVITVEDKDKNTHDLLVKTDSSLARKGDGIVNWNSIKIGDEVDVEVNYNEILQLDAVGKTSYVKGIVEEIYLSDMASHVTIKNNKTKKVEKYALTLDVLNIYEMQIGSEVELYLDSEEVEEIDILEDAPAQNYTGYVTYWNRQFIIIADSKDSTSTEKKLYYNSDTKFIDSTTGKVVDSSAVDEDMQVFVVMRTDKPGYMSTVTILKK